MSWSSWNEAVWFFKTFYYSSECLLRNIPLEALIKNVVTWVPCCNKIIPTFLQHRMKSFGIMVANLMDSLFLSLPLSLSLSFPLSLFLIEISGKICENVSKHASCYCRYYCCCWCCCCRWLLQMAVACVVAANVVVGRRNFCFCNENLLVAMAAKKIHEKISTYF